MNNTVPQARTAIAAALENSLAALGLQPVARPDFSKFATLEEYKAAVAGMPQLAAPQGYPVGYRLEWKPGDYIFTTPADFVQTICKEGARIWPLYPAPQHGCQSDITVYMGKYWVQPKYVHGDYLSGFTPLYLGPVIYEPDMPFKYPFEAIERICADLSTASNVAQPAAPGEELHFNAQRLRNVAKLVGLESVVPQDDATLDGARGAVLGQIAGKLREDKPTVAAAVNRFLGWPLPKTFSPDNGIAFNPPFSGWPTGTNLMNVVEAKAMFEYCLAAAPVPAPPAGQSEAARDVLAERRRQNDAEGYDSYHDDDYSQGALAAAAGCYALFTDAYPNAGQPPPDWPWDSGWWKPKDYRRDIVRAAALLLAEIERFDRAVIPAAQGAEK